MPSLLKHLAGVTLSFLLVTGAAMAQTSTIEGIVKGEDGAPLKDALVKIDRKDIKGHYEVKTKKKGDYLYTGLPLGTYRVSVWVDGKERDSVDNVRTKLGDSTVIPFDLHQQAAKQQAMQKAAETGQLTQEQARDMTPEQKAALEKQVKERSAAMQKNKALNDAFNGGMEALKANQFDAAVQSFQKAVELDPNQVVIWGNMAEAYSGLARTKTGAEQTDALNKAIEAYQKALALAPNDANYHNNFALALARAKKFPEMEQELNKAVQLDPTNAGRYYFNLGAVLVNANQSGPACDAFKKAIEADPNYADAHYQYGICLTSKATADATGKLTFPEGTSEAFQKYLALKPDGPNAESAKAMLQTMGSKIDTTYVAPGAQKKSGKKK